LEALKSQQRHSDNRTITRAVELGEKNLHVDFKKKTFKPKWPISSFYSFSSFFVIYLQLNNSNI